MCRAKVNYKIIPEVGFRTKLYILRLGEFYLRIQHTVSVATRYLQYEENKTMLLAFAFLPNLL